MKCNVYIYAGHNIKCNIFICQAKDNSYELWTHNYRIKQGLPYHALYCKEYPSHDLGQSWNIKENEINYILTEDCFQIQASLYHDQLTHSAPDKQCCPMTS